MSDKRQLGQYLTTTNPFATKVFKKWISENKENINNTVILEPFAGANNIPKMIYDEKILENNWDCFDIQPAKNKIPKFPIIEKDTIKNFPTGYQICITNPPYLSKNSATRRHLNFPDTKYDDLYKLCLEIMLNNVPYVAAIIPETFITSGLFHDRLKYVISLTCKMFDDTDCPVCLALFNPEKTSDFKIYRMNEYLGKYSDLSKKTVVSTKNFKWKINDKTGNIGIRCIDNTKEDSIEFILGSKISPDKIKVSSRALTRVSGIPDDVNLEEFLNKCNKILEKYRKETQDVFMASFKGLREDGKYRRRLDFATAKQIMSYALEELQNEKNRL